MHWALLACLWSALVLKISSAQTEYECSGIADGDGQQCWVHGTAYFGDLLATNLRAPALALTGVSPGAAVLLPANGCTPNSPIHDAGSGSYKTSLESTSHSSLALRSLLLAACPSDGATCICTGQQASQRAQATESTPPAVKRSRVSADAIQPDCCGLVLQPPGMQGAVQTEAANQVTPEWPASGEWLVPSALLTCLHSYSADRQRSGAGQAASQVDEQQQQRHHRSPQGHLQHLQQQQQQAQQHPQQQQLWFTLQLDNVTMLVKPLLLAQLQQSLNTVPSAALYIRESLPGSHILISHFQSKIVTARNVTLVAVAAGAQGRAALRAPPAAASEEGTSISQHDGIAAVNSISSGAAARRSLQAQDGSSSSTLFIRVDGNTSMWSALNASAVSKTIPGSQLLGSVTISLAFNTSVTCGMPSFDSTGAACSPSAAYPADAPSPPSAPPATGSIWNGSWTHFYQSIGNSLVGTSPTTLQLASSIAIQSGLDGGAMAELDFAALQHVLSLPPPAADANTNSDASNNLSGGNSATASSNSTSPNTLGTLTFSNLALVNLPPGQPSTYPLGLSLLGLWSINMDRSMPPGVGWGSPPTGSTPGPDGGSNQRVWVPPQGWVTEPQVLLRNCTIVVPKSEAVYWLLMFTSSVTYAHDQYWPALACNPSTAHAPSAPLPPLGANATDSSATSGSGVGTTATGKVPGWLHWLEELGLGLPLISSSTPSPASDRPAFTVCSWALNWGRILFEDVTIVGVSTDLRTTADVTILETGFRELVALKQSHFPGISSLLPPPLTMVSIVLPTLSNRIDSSSTTSPATGGAPTATNKLDSSSTTTLAAVNGNSTAPSSPSPPPPAASTSAVLDLGLLLQRPNTSAAAWAQGRLLILTVDTEWPDAAGVEAARQRFQNNSQGPVIIGGAYWTICGIYASSSGTPPALDFMHAPQAAVEFSSSLTLSNLVLMNLQAPGPGVSTKVQNCAASTALAPLGFLGLPLWPLDFCRAPTLANGLVETATISIAMCSVFLPPSDLQLLADLVAGRLLTEGIPASAEAPVRSTTCPRTCLPSDAPPRQLLATNSTDNSDSHGVNANFMVGGGNAVPRANSSSAFQNQVAGAVSTSDSVVASSPVASVIDTSGSPTTGSSVCSLHPVTRALAQTLVEVGRVVIPGPGATWLARGGLGVDRQTSWYGVQFTQVALVPNPTDCLGPSGAPLPFPITSASIVAYPPDTPPAAPSTTAEPPLPGGTGGGGGGSSPSGGSSTLPPVPRPPSPKGFGTTGGGGSNASGSPTGGSSSTPAGAVIGGAVGGGITGVVLLSALIAWAVVSRSRRKQQHSRAGGSGKDRNFQMGAPDFEAGLKALGGHNDGGDGLHQSIEGALDGICVDMLPGSSRASTELGLTHPGPPRLAPSATLPHSPSKWKGTTFAPADLPHKTDQQHRQQHSAWHQPHSLRYGLSLKRLIGDRSSGASSSLTPGTSSARTESARISPSVWGTNPDNIVATTPTAGGELATAPSQETGVGGTKSSRNSATMLPSRLSAGAGAANACHQQSTGARLPEEEQPQTLELGNARSLPEPGAAPQSNGQESRSKGAGSHDKQHSSRTSRSQSTAAAAASTSDADSQMSTPAEIIGALHHAQLGQSTTKGSSRPAARVERPFHSRPSGISGQHASATRAALQPSSRNRPSSIVLPASAASLLLAPLECYQLLAASATARSTGDGLGLGGSNTLMVVGPASGTRDSLTAVQPSTGSTQGSQLLGFQAAGAAAVVTPHRLYHQSTKTSESCTSAKGGTGGTFSAVPGNTSTALLDYYHLLERSLGSGATSMSAGPIDYYQLLEQSVGSALQGAGAMLMPGSDSTADKGSTNTPRPAVGQHNSAQSPGDTAASHLQGSGSEGLFSHSTPGASSSTATGGAVLHPLQGIGAAQAARQGRPGLAPITIDTISAASGGHGHHSHSAGDAGSGGILGQQDSQGRGLVMGPSAACSGNTAEQARDSINSFSTAASLEPPRTRAEQLALIERELAYIRRGLAGGFPATSSLTTQHKQTTAGSSHSQSRTAGTVVEPAGSSAAALNKQPAVRHQQGIPGASTEHPSKDLVNANSKTAGAQEPVTDPDSAPDGAGKGVPPHMSHAAVAFQLLGTPHFAYLASSGSVATSAAGTQLSDSVRTASNTPGYTSSNPAGSNRMCDQSMTRQGSSVEEGGQQGIQVHPLPPTTQHNNSSTNQRGPQQRRDSSAVPSNTSQGAPPSPTTSALLQSHDSAHTVGGQSSVSEGPALADQVPGLTLTGVLGSGSYGTVYQGTWHGLEVAVKRVVFQALGQGPAGDARRAQVLREAEVSARMDHPNLVATYTSAMVPVGGGAGHTGSASHLDWALVMVQEFANGGSLLEELKAGWLRDPGTGVIDIRLVLQFASDIAAGMTHLHANRIVHGDLKLDNVLLKHVTAQGSSNYLTYAKVCDFGLSLTLPTDRSIVSGVRNGTPMYVAPEVLHTGHTSTAADVYAFGIMCWELLHERTAWDQLLSCAISNPSLMSSASASGAPLQALHELLTFQDLPASAADSPDELQQKAQTATITEQGLEGDQQSCMSEREQQPCQTSAGDSGHRMDPPAADTAETISSPPQDKGSPAGAEAGHVSGEQQQRLVKQAYIQLASQCMSPDPRARPTFHEIQSKLELMRRVMLAAQSHS